MQPPPGPDRFRTEQDAFFERADADHFAWQTEAPYLAESEAALLDVVEPASRLLEVGCGEGGNLFHLADRLGRAAGVDRSTAKLRFARDHLPAVRFFRGDAAHLPVRDGAFDAVLIRDLLHHLPDRGSALREAGRVLRAGGTLTVIEPNGRSPLIWLHGALVAEEREAWRSTARRLREDIRAAGFAEPELSSRQPMPLYRVALHHRYGRPALGRRAEVRRIFDGVDAVARRLMPKGSWLYLVAHARRPARESP